jgi:hypothetical protein
MSPNTTAPSPTASVDPNAARNATLIAKAPSFEPIFDNDEKKALADAGGATNDQILAAFKLGLGVDGDVKPSDASNPKGAKVTRCAPDRRPILRIWNAGGPGKLVVVAMIKATGASNATKRRLGLR